MRKSLIRHEIVPFTLLFSGLIATTLLADFLLHQKKIVWVGRYWGYFGSLFIVLSFIYSLRKHKILRSGSPRMYLKAHEYLGWCGALLILVHGGIHFNGLLAWLAVAAMLVTVLSGLTGRILLKRSQRALMKKREDLAASGMDKEGIEDRIYWDSIAVDLMKKWRSIHIPITSVFITLALLHVLAIAVFWKWF
jgi:hypothetical protein